MPGMEAWEDGERCARSGSASVFTAYHDGPGINPTFWSYAASAVNMPNWQHQTVIHLLFQTHRCSRALQFMRVAR